MYHAIRFSATRQIRHCYGNKAAVRAAKAGQALADGSVLFAEAK
jgi:hypothetical protein